MSSENKSLSLNLAGVLAKELIRDDFVRLSKSLTGENGDEALKRMTAMSETSAKRSLKPTLDSTDRALQKLSDILTPFTRQLNERLKGFEDHDSARQRRLQDRIDRLDELRARINDLEAMAEAGVTHIHEVEEQADAHRKRLQELVAEAEASVSQVEERADAHHTRLQALVEEAEASANELKMQTEDWKSRAEELQQQATTNDEELVKSHKKHAHALERQAHAISKRISRLEERAQVRRSRLEDLVSRVETQEAETDTASEDEFFECVSSFGGESTSQHHSDDDPLPAHNAR